MARLIMTFLQNFYHLIYIGTSSHHRLNYYTEKLKNELLPYIACAKDLLDQKCTELSYDLTQENICNLVSFA